MLGSGRDPDSSRGGGPQRASDVIEPLDVIDEPDENPFEIDLVEPAKVKAAKAKCFLGDSKDGFYRLLAQSI